MINRPTSCGHKTVFESVFNDSNLCKRCFEARERERMYQRLPVLRVLAYADRYDDADAFKEAERMILEAYPEPVAV